MHFEWKIAKISKTSWNHSIFKKWELQSSSLPKLRKFVKNAIKMVRRGSIKLHWNKWPRPKAISDMNHDWTPITYLKLRFCAIKLLIRPKLGKIEIENQNFWLIGFSRNRVRHAIYPILSPKHASHSQNGHGSELSDKGPNWCKIRCFNHSITLNVIFRDWDHFGGLKSSISKTLRQ